MVRLWTKYDADYGKVNKKNATLKLFLNFFLFF